MIKSMEKRIVFSTCDAGIVIIGRDVVYLSFGLQIANKVIVVK